MLRKPGWRAARALAAAVVGVFLLSAAARGQTYAVTEQFGDGPGTLMDAVVQANAGNVSVISLDIPLVVVGQMFVNANVTIEGNGNTVASGGLDRIFFFAGGNISVNNVTLNGGAASGGTGYAGGGGGMGAGGAIFVANGMGIPGSNVTLPTNVLMSNVTFSNNTANGGNSDHGLVTLDFMGGGGGMGGDGDTGDDATAGEAGFLISSGGGGGFGILATGGHNDSIAFPTDPGPGSFTGAAPGGSTAFMSGGANGGGGGAGEVFLNSAPGGGGGGIGGQTGNLSGAGGDGGWGGGGGGSGSILPGVPGGAGGFGGGGGTGSMGGFGGGGGTTMLNQVSVPSSFGAGTNGGGGLGAGGAIFLMEGASLTLVDPVFTDNTVSGGSGRSFPIPNATDGLAIGADMFLGDDVTFNISAGNSLTLNGSLGGGAGDPDHTGDPNAQGGLVKQGGGELVLAGEFTYTGATVVEAGTLAAAGTLASSSFINLGAVLELFNNFAGPIAITLNGGETTLAAASTFVSAGQLQAGNLTLAGANTIAIIEQNGGGLVASGNSSMLSLQQSAGTASVIGGNAGVTANITGGCLTISGAQNQIDLAVGQAGSVFLDGFFSEMAGGSNITVEDGGLLFGSGEVDVPVLLNGGVLGPLPGGLSGSLVLAALDWNDAAQLRFTLTGEAEALAVLGAMTGAGSTFMLELIDGGGLTANTTYPLLEFASTTIVFSQFAFTVDNALMEGELVPVYAGSDLVGVNFHVSVIPEPGTWALVPAAVLAWVCRRGRRRLFTSANC